MSLITKKDMFLSKANTQYLVKQFFLLHRQDGGSLTPDIFQEQVPKLMGEWKILDIVDSYESLVDDPITELRVMDKDFINQHASVWGASGKSFLPKTWEWSALDYQTLDLPTAPEGIDVSSSMYRNQNKPYVFQQKIHNRHVDMKSDGQAAGRSLQQQSKGYDMSRVYETVDKPYKETDYLDAKPQWWSDGIIDTIRSSWTGF